MQKNIEVPAIGESVTEGILMAWLKKSGDYVEEGEEIFELETDKASIAVPSPCAGVLSISVKEDTGVEVGQIVGTIDTAATKSEEKPPAEEKRELSPTPAKEGARLSPSARRLVKEHDLEPEGIKGTGKDGIVNKEDVLANIAGRESQPSTQRREPPRQVEKTPKAPSASRGQRRVKMTNIRRRIAERLVQAQQNAAFLTTYNEANMSRIMALRKGHKQEFVDKHGVKLGFMSFFVKACCRALTQFPAVNAMIDGDDIVYHDYCDVGVAVSTDRGLVVPVLRNAESMSFPEVEQRIADYAQRARAKKLTIDELSGGTFTISNGGVFGSLMSSPIPNPPQTAILGMHAIQERPVAIDGRVVIQPMMYLALSYDHRLIDGREAVGFLVTVKKCVENPERILLEL